MTYKVIGAAYEVRRQLGNFLYEEIYESALQYELESQGIKSERQVYLPVIYKGRKLKDAYKVDLIVENTLPIEIKALPMMGYKEVKQLVSYMHFGKFNIGYLLNFGASDFSVGKCNDDYDLLKGIYRFVL